MRGAVGVTGVGARNMSARHPEWYRSTTFEVPVDGLTLLDIVERNPAPPPEHGESDERGGEV